MPKAKPGRTKHPLKDKLVGEAPQGFKAGFAGYNKVDPWLGSDSDSKPTNTKTEPKADPKADPKAKVDTKPAPQPKRNTGGWPTSQEGYTLKQGDLVDYNNANGKPRTKTEVVDLIPGKKDRNGHPQIQLTLRGATYAISRDQITAVNGKPFTLTNAEAGTGTIKDQLLNALEAYKGKMDESSKNLDAMDAEKLRKKYAKDWEVRKGKYLYKKVAFDDYNTVLRFLMVIEKPQIELDHFANIKFFYNEAELVVYTHDTNGLTVLDFKLAVQMDKALERMGAKEIG
jgi:pterin-4a-carbinolamine dehydratase